VNQNLTDQLIAAQQGDGDAREEIIRIVYRELHRMARNFIRRERVNHTLQPTALVNEVYLKLFDGLPIDLKNRSQFFSIAATQMRHILVDHARRKRALKRQMDEQARVMEDLHDHASLSPEDLIALDRVLTEFKINYPRAGSIVELRFFCGMTENESAEVLQISVSTLKREWGFAKVWLLRELSRKD
jgi:RNA polymerase sigma-70 factor (ECF subfamily)